MITGNGCSLKRFPRLLLLFWIRFLTAFKREKKNYGVSPPWLAGNNPLLLFCASFFSKASKFSFLKIFNSPFEDTLKRAARATLISYQGLRSSFPSPLMINLLFGLVDRVWKAHPRAGKTWKFRLSSEGSRKTWSRGSPPAEEFPKCCCREGETNTRLTSELEQRVLASWQCCVHGQRGKHCSGFFFVVVLLLFFSSWGHWACCGPWFGDPGNTWP